MDRGFAFRSAERHRATEGRNRPDSRRQANNQSQDRRLSRRKAEWLAPSLFPGHGDGNIKSADMKPRRFPPPWTIEDNGAFGHRVA